MPSRRSSSPREVPKKRSREESDRRRSKREESSTSGSESSSDSSSSSSDESSSDHERSRKKKHRRGSPDGKAERDRGRDASKSSSSKPSSSINEPKDKTQPQAGIVQEMVKGRTGGVYIPPFKLAQMKKQVEDKTSEEYQRMTWEALRKSINGLINKVLLIYNFDFYDFVSLMVA